jgi:hypothetical protein
MEAPRSRIRIWSERLLLFLYIPLVFALITNTVIGISRATSQRITLWVYALTILAAIIIILLSVLAYKQTIGTYLDRREQNHRAKQI